MATVAILIWPIIALILYARLPAVQALIWGTLIPYLFLPERYVIELPGLPDLDKTAIITVSTVLGILFNKQKFAESLRENPTVVANRKIRFLSMICLGLIFIGIVVTVMKNGDLLVYGETVLPRMRLWDAISLIGEMALYIAPFLFARKYLASPAAHRRLLSALVVMGLVYSLFMLIEIRLSPQMHYWVYGYYQHSFLQHIRDGYRPMVFLEHGLWVGFFMFMSVISAFVMWKAEKNIKWLFYGCWLFLVLALSENLAALLIAILLIGALFFVGSRLQITIGIVIAAATLFYPMLRQAQLIPINQILNAASSISEDRAASLLYRIDNETDLLDKSLQRPVYGWGSFGRELVYNERGRNTSVSEGLWILTISRRGWVGYAGLFGLLTMPIFFLLSTRRRKPIPPESLGLAIIITGNLIYIIPNATLTAIGWLVFGALAGFVQNDLVQPVRASPETRSEARSTRKNRYTRFGPKVATRASRT